jgi:hypothetical protein
VTDTRVQAQLPGSLQESAEAAAKLPGPPRQTAESTAMSANAPPPAAANSDGQRRGVAWLWLSALVCPCHFPLIVLLALSGTVAGVAVRQHLTWLYAISAVLFAGFLFVGLRFGNQGRMTLGARAIPRQRGAPQVSGEAVVSVPSNGHAHRSRHSGVARFLNSRAVESDSEYPGSEFGSDHARTNLAEGGLPGR